VQVTVKAERLNALDLAIDFTDLKRLMGEIVDPLDHTCINDRAPFDAINPSSENIARWIFEALKPKLAPYAVTLHTVTVWESETASAAYSES
jgi:6-pyruvoyltetrahydropterin/6-carboxytetrahydropterin synthase